MIVCGTTEIFITQISLQLPTEKAPLIYLGDESGVT